MTYSTNHHNTSRLFTFIDFAEISTDFSFVLYFWKIRLSSVTKSRSMQNYNNRSRKRAGRVLILKENSSR